MEYQCKTYFHTKQTPMDIFAQAVFGIASNLASPRCMGIAHQPYPSTSSNIGSQVRFSKQILLSRAKP